MLVTARLRPGLPSLRRAQEQRLLLALFAEPRGVDFRVVHYAIQTNHVHWIVEARCREALKAGVRSLLIRMARGLNALWGRRGALFAGRFHERPLATPREVRGALVYVLQNARKHGVDLRGPDPCSSGPWFDGWHLSRAEAQQLAGVRTKLSAWIDAAPPQGRRDVALDSAPTRLPFAEPRTWLLSTGWRRWGSIRLDERPATPHATRKPRGARTGA